MVEGEVVGDTDCANARGSRERVTSRAREVVARGRRRGLEERREEGKAEPAVLPLPLSEAGRHRARSTATRARRIEVPVEEGPGRAEAMWLWNSITGKSIKGYPLLTGRPAIRRWLIGGR